MAKAKAFQGVGQTPSDYQLTERLLPDRAIRSGFYPDTTPNPIVAARWMAERRAKLADGAFVTITDHDDRWGFTAVVPTGVPHEPFITLVVRVDPLPREYRKASDE